MSVFVALRTLLLADADVAAVTTRIYPAVPQTPTLPVIVLEEVDCPIDQLIDYAHPRWQATAWVEGGNYEEGENLAKLIRYCLQRYRGIVAGVTIEQITYLNKTYVRDPETGRETFPTDFGINYWEE